MGEPYRRLFELRVLLATLKPTAGCLGQVSVALNEMRTLEKREIVEWTKDERALESSIVLHLQESLSRCFIMYKTAFPHAAVQNGALSLAVHVFSLVMDDSDEDMRTLIIQHADRMVDIILQGSDLDGSIVKPRILSCLLFELRRDLRDTMDLYRSSFPDGVKIIETHSAQYAGPESRVRNAIVNCVSNMSSQQMESDEAITTFDEASALNDLVRIASPDTQVRPLTGPKLFRFQASGSCLFPCLPLIAHSWALQEVSARPHRNSQALADRVGLFACAAARHQASV